MTDLEGGWWVTVVRAWHQESHKSGIVIRMTNSSGSDTRVERFASIDEALEQLRSWLVELERSR
jgi:hypothetical protein